MIVIRTQSVFSRSGAQNLKYTQRHSRIKRPERRLQKRTLDTGSLSSLREESFCQNERKKRKHVSEDGTEYWCICVCILYPLNKHVHDTQTFRHPVRLSRNKRQSLATGCTSHVSECVLFLPNIMTRGRDDEDGWQSVLIPSGRSIVRDDSSLQLL